MLTNGIRIIQLLNRDYFKIYSVEINLITLNKSNKQDKGCLDFFFLHYWKTRLKYWYVIRIYVIMI